MLQVSCCTFVLLLQMPDIEFQSSQKTAERGAVKLPEEHPKHPKTAVFRVFRMFFRLSYGTFFGCFCGCFQCRAFGTSVDGRRDCNPRMVTFRNFRELKLRFEAQAQAQAQAQQQQQQQARQLQQQQQARPCI